MKRIFIRVFYKLKLNSNGQILSIDSKEIFSKEFQCLINVLSNPILSVKQLGLQMVLIQFFFFFIS